VRRGPRQQLTSGRALRALEVGHEAGILSPRKSARQRVRRREALRLLADEQQDALAAGHERQSAGQQVLPLAVSRIEIVQLGVPTLGSEPLLAPEAAVMLAVVEGAVAENSLAQLHRTLGPADHLGPQPLRQPVSPAKHGREPYHLLRHPAGTQACEQVLQRRATPRVGQKLQLVDHQRGALEPSSRAGRQQRQELLRDRHREAERPPQQLAIRRPAVPRREQAPHPERLIGRRKVVPLLLRKRPRRHEDDPPPPQSRGPQRRQLADERLARARGRAHHQAPALQQPMLGHGPRLNLQQVRAESLFEHRNQRRGESVLREGGDSHGRRAPFHSMVPTVYHTFVCMSSCAAPKAA